MVIVMFIKPVAVGIQKQIEKESVEINSIIEKDRKTDSIWRMKHQPFL